MDLRKVRINVESQEDGVWVPLDGETSILVARMHNKKFNKLFQRLSAPYKNTARKGLLKDEKADEILAKVIAKTVLLDWKGLKDDEKEIPYSVEKAEEILNDESLSTFRELVIEAAADEESFREEEIQSSIKKSKDSLSGTKSGEKT